MKMSHYDAPHTRASSRLLGLNGWGHSANQLHAYIIYFTS